MASRAGRLVSNMWKLTSAACSSTPASRSAASVAGGRSLPRSSSPYTNALPHKTRFDSRRSIQFSAAPGDVRCMSSMIPRHNATATARLVSRLSGDLCPELEGDYERGLVGIEAFTGIGNCTGALNLSLPNGG